MLCKVTHCAGCVLANTRSHHDSRKDRYFFLHRTYICATINSHMPQNQDIIFGDMLSLSALEKVYYMSTVYTFLPACCCAAYTGSKVISNNPIGRNLSGCLCTATYVFCQLHMYIVSIPPSLCIRIRLVARGSGGGGWRFWESWCLLTSG